MRNKLGKALRTARKSAGLTQDQLAKRSGMARSEICELETGVQRHIVKVAQAEKLASILGVPTLMLLELGRPDFKVWQRAFRSEVF